MTEHDQKIWDAIASVINGNPSKEEQQIFDTWITESEGNKKFYETLLHSNTVQETFDSQAKKRVYEKIETEVRITRASGKINLWRYSAVAAIAILLTLAISKMFIKSNNETNISYIESQTPFGVKSKINLPDGSIAYLNSGSSFKYPSSFNGKQRKVFLCGEAYFEVTKDPKHPFIVETGELNVKVLGTHFNVKNFSDDENVEVSLLEGSVEVMALGENNKQNKARLAPNQQATYNKKSKVIHKHRVDAELSTIWKDGKYYFENERFSAIASKLERNFNVKIKTESEELNKKVFSGLFDKNKSIYQMLDVIKNYCRFNYFVVTDTIIIRSIPK